LVLEATSEVAYTAPSIRCHIWHFPNVIEHVSAREQQDGDQTDGSPEVAVLDDGENVGRRDGEEGDDAEHRRNGDRNPHVVDRTHERWVWYVW